MFAPLVASRMNPNYGQPAVPALPVLAVYRTTDTAIEGDSLVFEVRRTGHETGTCSATWTAASAGGSGDLSGTLTATVTLEPGRLTAQIAVQTVNRSGTQGDREVSLTLSAPGGCTLDPTKLAASIVLQDRAAAATAYVYEDVPSVVLPTDDSKYDVWNIPAAGGSCPTTGSSSKILIMVAPDAEITGEIRAIDLKYRAAFLIGATIRTRGAGIQVANGNDIWGGQVLTVNWHRSITHRPVLFISNLDYNSRNATKNNDWGDFLNVGTKVDPADKLANMDQWVDFFMQKVICYGHWGFSNDAGGDTPHSDFVQPKSGGFRNATFTQIDVTWGYQTFYVKGTNITDDKCHIDGRNRFRRIMMRPMPNNTTIYGSSGTRKFVYVIPVGVPSAAATQLPAGNYQAVTFDRVFAERGGSGGNDLKAYFSPGSTPAGSIAYSGNRVTFPQYVSPVKGRPLWTGFVDFTEPPTPVVTAGEVGYAVKVSTPAALRAIFPNWWDLPRRSGRAWASGVAYWMGADASATNADITAEEADVALIDAGTGSSRARGNLSDPPHTSNVANWDGVIGGPVSGPMDTTQTQMDWNPNVLYGIGDIIAQLPPSVSGGSGWINWAVQTIPDSEDTDSGADPSIWTDIVNGAHDDRYKKWGERIVQKMAAVGHPVGRLLIDPNREMNDPDNVYGILPGDRGLYQAAMERTIEMMRLGAGQRLRFVHRPAWKHNIGPYADWVPGNIDVLSLSIHPDASVTSNADITAMFNGTLSSSYYGLTEFLAAADDMGLPIAFPEWSPRYESGQACVVANTFVTRWYDEILAPNAARLVCECVYRQNVRQTGTGAYKGGDAPGLAQWNSMVATRKTKWSGIKS